MAIYTMLSKVWESINSKKPCAALFLDMSRAFDCVVPNILLQQLDRIGIRGSAFQLFQSYFCGRIQTTILNSYNKSSKTIEITQSRFENVVLGVPQGSILGPLLFLIYVNELPSITKHLTVLYADDATVLFVKNEYNSADYGNDIADTLRILMKWLHTLNLQTNITKTKIMQFHNYMAKPTKLIINIDNDQVSEVKETDFLGISLDSNLNWKSHLNKINSRIASYCYALSVLVDVSSVDVAKCAYYGNIFPLLTYGIIFWGNSVNIQYTFLLQKRSLRIIYSKNSDDSLRLLFIEKGFLTLTGIYILELSMFVKNNMHLFKKKSEMRLVSAPIRGRDYLYAPAIKSMIYNKSTYVSAIQVYNSLPIIITDISNINIFKTKLKRWLLTKAFYNMNEFLNRHKSDD